MLALPCAARLAGGIEQWRAVDGVAVTLPTRDDGGCNEAMSMVTLGT